MAIIAGVTAAFKIERSSLANTNAAGDVYKLSLYGPSANLDPSTLTAYTATGEVTGTGYTAGGIVLTGFTPGNASGVGWIDWADPVWSNATITAYGGVIYNSSKSGAALEILEFTAQNSGNPISSTNGNFTVQFPPPGATTGLLRTA